MKEMFVKLVKQVAEFKGITEKLKSENQIERVDCVNNIGNIIHKSTTYIYM